MSQMVHIAALGRCEHCGTILNVSDAPADAMDAVWKCPKCKKEITGLSFGYDGNNQKFRWVGPNGEWTRTKPKEDFNLGNLLVVVQMPALRW